MFANKVSMLLTLSGIVIIAFGVSAMLLMPFIVTNVIYERMTLEPNTEAYQMWKTIPLPIHVRFYFFNVTNAGDIERFGAKPELAEIGPFTYESKWRKIDIDNRPNGTVAYREIKTYHFVDDLSAANENETIVTLNGPLAITLSLLQNAAPAVRLVVTLALDAVTEGFFIKRTVRQLLFDGYPDLLTTFGPLLNPKMPTNNNGRFGWLYGRNGTDEGSFSVNTGRDDIQSINFIDQFAGQSDLNYWPNGSDCNSLDRSTNAEIFPPVHDQSESLYLFHPDFCRRWQLRRNRTLTVDGISAYRYQPDDNTFQNAADYPPNACFASQLPSASGSSLRLLSGGRSNSVRPKRIRFASGVFDLSACKYGAPVLMSFPHFYGADPVYQTTVDGLRPNATLHQFFVDVEPTVGASVRSAARVQINVYINKPAGLFRYRHIPDIVFPVFWQELSVDMTDSFADRLKWVLKQPALVSTISSAALLVSGSLLVLLTLLFPLYSRRQTSKADNKIAPGSDNYGERVDKTQFDDLSEMIDTTAGNGGKIGADMNNGVHNPALDPN